MYECLDCGAEFETPDATELEAGTGCNVNTCPECGSDDIVEADDYEDLDSNDDADLDLGDEGNE